MYFTLRIVWCVNLAFQYLFGSLLFKQEGEELIFGDRTISIIVYLVKYLFYLIICLLGSVKECFYLLNWNVPAVVGV